MLSVLLTPELTLLSSLTVQATCWSDLEAPKVLIVNLLKLLAPVANDPLAVKIFPRLFLFSTYTHVDILKESVAPNFKFVGPFPSVPWYIVKALPDPSDLGINFKALE